MKISNGLPPAFAAIVTNAYPVPSTGKYEVFYAISQIYTELVFQCPAAMVASESVAAGFPTWRYYYNASFPNTAIRPELATIGLGDLDLEAFHGSEISLVFGNYPRENATAKEVALSKTMQTAWANFVKDPQGKGPGWPKYGLPDGKANPVGVAGLGLGDDPAVKMIPQTQLDSRCPLYTPVYAEIHAPAF